MDETLITIAVMFMFLYMWDRARPRTLPAILHGEQLPDASNPRAVGFDTSQSKGHQVHNEED